MKITPLLFFLSVVGFSAVYAGGYQTLTTTVAVEESGPFEKGGHEVDVAGMLLHSPVIVIGHRPVLNYAQGDISMGWMLTSPSPLFNKNWLRGNWEFLGNAFGAGVVGGPKGYMVGGRVLLRYNFVQPDTRWVPFWQLGAGALGDDIYKNHPQTEVGGPFEFTLVSDAGVRYFITQKCAAILMADFEHVSNAGLYRRNLGVNAVGGSLGLGFFF